MPLGTGAETLQHIPTAPYVMDPGQFFAMTKKNVLTPKTIAHPGAGQAFSATLLQTGVVSKLRLIFDGTLTVATAAVTTSDEWPYALLDDFKLSANGQSDLFSVDGLDLHCLRFARYPAYEDAVDAFAGTVGGGNSVGVGATALHLEYEVPIAMDDTSLVGALYAQSSATNLVVKGIVAPNTRLFSANPANATITGTWYLQETLFEIPFDAKGQLVVPDLTKLHGVIGQRYPLTTTGESRVPLIRSAGQLTRLFFSARSSATNRLSAAANAATTKKIDRIRVEYGGNQRPLVWDPATSLLAENNQHYHAPLPFDRLCVDLVRENPARDAILLQGLTELAVVPTINSAVVIGTPTEARLVQETLY